MIEDATRYRGGDTPADAGGFVRTPANAPGTEGTPVATETAVDVDAASGDLRQPDSIFVANLDAPPLSLAELARRFGEMVWLEARLYEVVGWWSTFEADDALAVLFAELSRHHGWHAELWQSALPDTPGLAPTDQIAPPHAGWVELFQALVELDDPAGSADRVAVLALVIDPWIRIRNEQLTAALNPVSDRAIARIQRFVTMDHTEDHTALMAALTRIPGGPTSPVPDQVFPLIGGNH